MQKRFTLFFFMLVMGISISYAQQVTGVITSADDEMGVPGANILIKGTLTGAITDIDGKFLLNASPTDTLLISCLGMASQEVFINGRNHLDIEMVPDSEQLSEVVVTALGIRREDKALGYAVQTVSGDVLSSVKELDVVNALSGRVAGVDIIQADGGIGGGGSRIVIRGESSLAGNNDPIYIINGIRGKANDVASDDIESMSVLKGPSAAALYGAEAGGGVVIITSKSGKGNSGISVDINSNITFQSPLVLPEYQNAYGQGSGFQYSYLNGNGYGLFDDSRESWGPAFDGELRPQFNGNRPWVAYPNNVKDFYELGHIYVNNVAVSQISDKSNFRFSYTNTDQKGIMPNNGLKQNRFDLNSNFQISPTLHLRAGMNYNRSYSPNNRNVEVRYTPRNIDLKALKQYWIPGLEGYEQLNYRRSDNNPYFVLRENTFSYNDTRMIVNVSADWEALPGLNLTGRYASIYENNESYDKNAYSTYVAQNPLAAEGYYYNGQRNTLSKTADFLAVYTKNFNAFVTRLSFGGTHYRNEINNVGGSINSLRFLDLWNLNNRTRPVIIHNWISEMERNSLYGFLNLEYKGMLYLDLTARNDWSSTLHPDNNSFFYPSVAFSGVISEMVNLPHVINFLKIRASSAMVGKDISEPYFIEEQKFGWVTDMTTGETRPFEQNFKTDPFLKPEKTTGHEIGTDIRLFGNRLGLDAAVYQSVTKNQILKIPVSEATGYNFFMVNTGEVKSEGVEITLTGSPIKRRDWQLDFQLNWSTDRTIVTELIDSIPDFNKTQKVNAFTNIEDRVGQRRGTFYGRSYMRAPDGQQLFTLNGDTRKTGYVPLGNYNPEWVASFNTDFRYKRITTSFLLDLRYGGLIYNEMERRLNLFGLSRVSEDRMSLIPNGVVEMEDGSFVPLNQILTEGKSGQDYMRTMMEETVPENLLFDNTYLKLRSVRIAYDLPVNGRIRLPIKSATVAFVGRNLFVWSKIKHIDPETFGNAQERSDFGYAVKVPGFAVTSLPSVRSYGFSLNLKF
jgi:TonB-linked SusC/RagA family outer membrane protein